MKGIEELRRRAALLATVERISYEEALLELAGFDPTGFSEPIAREPESKRWRRRELARKEEDR